MKKIKWGAIITTIIFITFFIMFIIFSVISNITLSTIFSGASGVLATIAFGLWVSYIFQKENDNRSNKRNEKFKKEIREKEFRNLKSYLSGLVGEFNFREHNLVSEIDGLKGSFGENSIDIENLTLNYFVFDEVYNNIDNYFGDSTEYFGNGKNEIQNLIKDNIDILYMREPNNTKKIGNIVFGYNEIYETFSQFNDECIRLFETMNQLNIQFKMEIFSKEEIEAIWPFTRKIGIGYFKNFYPPYEIITLFKHLIKIESFVKANFIPYCMQENFWSDFEKGEQEAKEYDKKIISWKEENIKKATEFLNKKFHS